MVFRTFCASRTKQGQLGFVSLLLDRTAPVSIVACWINSGFPVSIIRSVLTKCKAKYRNIIMGLHNPHK